VKTQLPRSRAIAQRSGRIFHPLHRLSCAGALAATALLGACATTPSTMTEQPDITALVRPYAGQLEAAGVTRIDSPGVGGAESLAVQTPYGYFDVRYGAGVAPEPFVLIARNGTVRVLSNTYTPAQYDNYQKALAWAVPEVLRQAPRNEAAMRALQAGSGR
jgi:hypothetical protein